MSKIQYFRYNTHQSHEAETNRYPSFTDNGGDVVYIVPFFIPEIADITEIWKNDAEFEAFLYSELGSGQGIMTLDGCIYCGADIHDHL